MAKYALCVGINDYPGTGNDLQGCVNDAKDWNAELEARGYKVTLLLDGAATQDGLLAALTELVTKAQANDAMVFTFSGHGSWQPDENADEDDQRDEMLCPHDIMTGGRLLDDDLHEIFSQKAKGANLFFFSDSCHSGSVAKFAPPLGPNPAVRVPRYLPPEVFLKDAKVLESVQRLALAPRSSAERYPALLVAGCRDVEYSYDAEFGGRKNGAFTYVALDALKKSPKNPKQWYAEIRKRLPSVDYPQTPQLYGSTKRKSGGMF